MPISYTDPYVYPGSRVLRNLRDIRDDDELERIERLVVQYRIEQGSPHGNFDLPHLQTIHKHLFQDIYPWAGEIRTVELAKGESHFLPCPYIGTGMADIHGRLFKANFFVGSSVEAFAAAAGSIIGDVNYVHPFREGNGRTQLQYLKQLTMRAGHDLDLTQFRPQAWLDASRAAQQGDYESMSAEIKRALIRVKTH